tara:strand:+ start:816 stop:1208 length:393 start_codon:yes stop_codon:yes gene_type:complete
VERKGITMASELQKAVEEMTYNMMSTILAHPDKFSDEKVKVAEAKFKLEKVKGDTPKPNPKRVESFAQDTTTSLENMKNLGKNKGGLTKPKMMYGGMANKKKHNYAAGGSVKDRLGVMIAVGKIKPNNAK